MKNRYLMYLTFNVPDNLVKKAFEFRKHLKSGTHGTHKHH